MPRVLLCLFLLSGPHLLSQDVPAPEKYREVEAQVREMIESGVAPSAAVVVIENDRIVWAKGYGHANIEEKRAATADTIYLLASVSKPITATGLMKLVEAGKLELDDPVNAHLPGAKVRAEAGDASEMTLRRLANHTAGFAEHWTFFYEPTSPPGWDVTIERHGFAPWKPGSRMQYSNLAFGLLGHVTEVKANTPWREWMEREVFDPIGMTRSSTRVRPEHADDAAVPYRRDMASRFLPLPPYDFDHPGASACWSSARDLALFLRAFMNDGEVDGRRLLTRSSTSEMLTKRAAPVSSYGVGWHLTDTDEGPIFSHSGGMPGVSTRVMGHAKRKNGFVVLTNSSDRRLTNAVRGSLSGILFPTARRAEEPRPPNDRLAVTLAGRWNGVLRHHQGDIPVMLDGGKVGVNDAIVVFGEGKRHEVQLHPRRTGFYFQVNGMRLATQDGFQGTANLRFQLGLSEDGTALEGVCNAIAGSYCCLPFAVRLTKPGARAQRRIKFDRADGPAYSFVLPAGWKQAKPRSRMRLTQFTMPGGIECVVYFFGRGGGGGVRANIDRWVGQFETEKDPVEREIKWPGGEAVLVDVTGRYVAEVRPGAPQRHDKAGQRMLAAILDIEGGPLYVKAVGPAGAIASQTAPFEAWIKSLRKE